MSDLKTIEQWEKLKNVIIVTDPVDPKQKLSEEDFDDIPVSDKDGNLNKVYVMYDFRVDFLKKNGYKVTRENMVNADLPNTTTKPADLSEALADQLKNAADILPPPVQPPEQPE